MLRKLKVALLFSIVMLALVYSVQAAAPFAKMPQYTPKLQISSQDYIDSFFNWTFVKQSNTTYLASFVMVEPFATEARDCYNKVSDDVCWDTLREKYFPNYTRAMVVQDIKNLTNYPRKGISSAVSFSALTLSLPTMSGSFTLTLTGKDYQEYLAKFGFASTVVTLDAVNTPWLENGRQLCQDGRGYLHLAWRYNDTAIAYSKSNDTGTTWTTTIYNVDTGTNKNPGMGCWGDNVAFGQFSGVDANLDIWMSDNNGASFTAYEWDTSCTGDYGNIEVRGNRVYANCKDQSADQAVDFFQGWINGTLSVTKQNVVQIAAQDINRPSLAVYGSGNASDIIYVEAVEATTSNDPYYSYSLDGGATFSANASISTFNVYMGRLGITANEVFFVGYASSTTSGWVSVWNTTIGGATWTQNYLDEADGVSDNAYAPTISFDILNRPHIVYELYNKTGDDARELIYTYRDEYGRWQKKIEVEIENGDTTSLLRKPITPSSYYNGGNGNAPNWRIPLVYKNNTPDDLLYSYIQLYNLTYNTSLTFQDNVTSSSGTYSIDGANNIITNGAPGAYMAYVSGPTDDVLAIYNITTITNILTRGGVTNASVPRSTDGIWALDKDDRNLIYACAPVDDAMSIINITNTAAPVIIGGTPTTSANPNSLDGCQAIEVWKTATGDYLVAIGAVTDDTITILNVTNPTAITNVTYRLTAANPCTTDDIQWFEFDEARNILIASSYTDDTISLFNVSTFPASNNITCISQSTDSAPPYSLDGAEGMYYDDASKLLYATSAIDGELTVLDLTNPASIVQVGGYTNSPTTQAWGTTWLATDVVVAQYNNIRTAFVASRGNTTMRGSITAINVLDPNSAGMVAINYYNYTQGTCINNLIENIQLSPDNMSLLYVSSADDCLYAINLYANTTISTTDTIAPNAPTELAITGQTETTISISWNEPPNSDLNHTEVWYNTSTVYFSQNVSTPTEIATINGLTGSVTYTITVVPVDHTGNRGNNVSVTGTTSAPAAPDLPVSAVIINVSADNALNDTDANWTINFAANMTNMTFFDTATKKLVFAVNFDANTSVIQDLSTYDMDSTTSYVSDNWGRTGRLGSGAINLTDISGEEYIIFADEAQVDYGSANLTFEFVFKKTEDVSYGYLLSKRNLSEEGYAIYVASDEAVSVYSGGEQKLTAAGAVSLNNWHHIMVQYNSSGTGARAVVDGVYGSWIAIAGETPNNHELYIGGRSGASYSIAPNGILDEVKMYNYVMTDAQINESYAAYAGNRSARLMASETSACETWNATLWAGNFTTYASDVESFTTSGCSAAAPTYVLEPYVMAYEDTTEKIRLIASDAVNLSIAYKTGAGAWTTVTNSSYNTTHEISITGLTAGTIYDFNVTITKSDGGSNNLYTSTFKTNSYSETNFRFAVISDTQGTASTCGGVATMGQAMLDEITTRGVNFVVSTGDNAEFAGCSDTLESYRSGYTGLHNATDQFRDTTNIPILYLIGNHEGNSTGGYSLNSTDAFQEYVMHPTNGNGVTNYQEKVYSWRYGNSMFVMLDTEELALTPNISGNQFTWFNTTLSKQNAEQENYDETTCTDGYANLVDGDWGTSVAMGSGASCLVNYTKPIGATGAIWTVKDSGTLVSGPTGYNCEGGAGYQCMYDITVPQACWDANPDKIMFNLDEPGGDLYWKCWDGDSWETILYTYDGGNMFEEQINWVEDYTHKFVFAHKALAGSYRNDTWYTIAGRDPTWSAVLDEIMFDKNVTAAFYGHEHNYNQITTQNGDMIHVINGGGGGSLADCTWNVTYPTNGVFKSVCTKRYGYLIVDVNGTRMTTYAYDNNSVLIESFERDMDKTAPSVSLVSPTPANGTYDTASIFVNVTGTDTNRFGTFVDFDNDTLLWMKLDNNLVDSSGHYADGTYQNGTWYNKFDFGAVKNTVEFVRGNQEFIRIPNSNTLTLNNFTATAWVKIPTGNVADDYYIIAQGDKCVGTSGSWILSVADDAGHLNEARFQVEYTSGVIVNTYSTGVTLNDNQWHKVTGRRAGSNISIFVDGVYINSSTMSTNSFTASENITIGGENCAGTENMNGSIDDVKLIGRAWSNAEVAADYNTTASYSYNFTGLAYGTYDINLFGVDLAGNSDTDSRTIVLSTTSTCTCPGVDNNWAAALSDYCIITTDCNLGTGRLSFTGSGNFSVKAVINTTGLGDPGANGIVWMFANGVINVK